MYLYCEVCDWSLSDNDGWDVMPGDAAITYFLATGHSIASERQEQRSCGKDYRIQETLR